MTKTTDTTEESKVDLHISARDWDNLLSAIHGLVSGFDEDKDKARNPSMGFLGGLLQSIKIDFSFEIPTACIYYKAKYKQFQIEINPTFFRQFTPRQRGALLLHEIYHMLFSHMNRAPLLPNHRLANIAADMTINQLIDNLPFIKEDLPKTKGFQPISVEAYGFEKNLTMEQYYRLLVDKKNEEEDKKDKEDGEGGSGDGEGGDLLDDHEKWDSNVDEGEMLDAVEDVIKRTMNKTSYTHSNLPSFVQDILNKIESRRGVLQWKSVLRVFIKKTVTGIDKENTRTRPNKRYGYQAPGLKLGELPKLNIYIDTSGSISTVELNEFLDEVDEILKCGMRNVNVCLWHTSLYSVNKYKKGNRNSIGEKVQSGGTDFEECAKHIMKTKPDAVVVLTDLFWSNTTTQIDSPVLYVVSKGGAAQPPTTYRKQRIIKMSNHA
jgi:predicted metal-dependent peptidase